MLPNKTMSIDINKVNFYPPLIQDYLNGSLLKNGIVNWEYSKCELKSKIKNRFFSIESRKLLVERLRIQNSGIVLTSQEEDSLIALENESTLTITTGHQLTLLGGPLFFYSKILDVVKLCKEMSTSENRIIPVFWMASEDHDYDEISSVNLFGKKLSCPGKNKGPVGRIKSEYFNDFLNEVNVVLGDTERFNKIKTLINKSFKEGVNLAEITRLLVRSLFANEGLLIIDGDDLEFKKQLIPMFKQELFEETAFKSSEAQISKIAQTYKVQVNPRKINLFYIEDELRVRIERVEDGFKTVDDQYSWSADEMNDLIESKPEKISPNVILRPVYQEIILPNVAYIGGAGEIAYWLELSKTFESFNIQFPLPVVRKSYFLIQEKLTEWLGTHALAIDQLFGDIDVLINNFTKSLSTEVVSLDLEITNISKFYEELLLKGKAINPQLEKVVLGEEKRAISALRNLEKRFLNTEKQRHEVTITKLKNLISKIFPNGSPMERVDSYFPFLVNPALDYKKEIEKAGSVLDVNISLIKY